MTKTRKILAVLVAAVMLLSVVALAACKATPLPAPVVTIDGDGVASWQAVKGATGYVYKIGNGNEISTTETEMTGALDDGDSIIVKAVGDGSKYSDSEWSAPQTYTMPTASTLTAPVVTISAAGLASWTAVANASGYIYKINDGQEISLPTTTLSVQLTAGQKIVVKAVGDEINYEDSAYSEARTYVAKLATPIVTIDTDTGLATWPAVANATGYVYKINGGQEQTANGLSVQLVENDTLVVKAVTTTTGYSDSDFSAAQTYTSAGVVVALDKPVVEIDDEGNATWAEVANAVGYTYKINDGKEQNTTNRSVKLQDGETIVVKAISGDAAYVNSDYSDAKTYVKPIVRDTFYERDSDIIQEGNYRYQIFTTNKTNAETDSVIAIRRGTLENGVWTYGNYNVAIEGNVSGWDRYIGTASVVKGVFTKGSEIYNYLMAYCATNRLDTSSTEISNEIGFAVAKDIMGEWTKLNADEPLIKFSSTGTGCYAPSLVNPSKQGAVRLFYTFADALGHFPRFVDLDMNNLNNIDMEENNMLPIEGTSDRDGMFPNSDWAYDATNKKYYAAKDISPAPDGTSHFANEFELVVIDEDELYTTDKGNGYTKVASWDYGKLGLTQTDRMHSPCIVTDEYGCISSTTTIELDYSFCSAQQGSSSDYLFTQRIRSVTYTAE